MERQHLIIGLGNPGREYVHTRHNAGFMVVERLAERWHVGWKLEKRFRARVARADGPAGRVWLCRPQTFMNASGEAAQAMREFYRIALDRVLVVDDDADLPLGEIRLRPKGGTGGHHGLASVLAHFGDPGYARQRIGIGRRENGVRQITGHVLGSFRNDEATIVDKVLQRCCEHIECWLEAGIQQAMNRFNGLIES